MTTDTYRFADDGYEPLFVDDMGEDCLVLSQPNESGAIERVAVSRKQMQEALDATAMRYVDRKNKDRAAPASAVA